MLQYKGLLFWDYKMSADPITWWIPETLEAAETQRRQEAENTAIDKQYEDPDFVAQKKAENLRNSPYGKYEPYTAAYEADIALAAAGFETRIGPSESSTLSERQESITSQLEWEYMPLFAKFAEEWKLTPDELQTLWELDINSQNYKEVLEGSNLDRNTVTQLTDCLDYIHDENRIEEARWELEKDFPDVFWEFQKTDEDGEKVWTNGFYEQAFNELAVHYLPGEDHEQAMNMALAMTAGKLWADVDMSLNVSSQELFKKNIALAMNPEISIAERFIALATILQIDNKIEWIKWKTKLWEQRRMLLSKKLKELWKLEEYEQALRELKKAKEENNSRSITLAQAKIEELEEEANLGDIWANWDIELETGWVEWWNSETT